MSKNDGSSSLGFGSLHCIIILPPSEPLTNIQGLLLQKMYKFFAIFFSAHCSDHVITDNHGLKKNPRKLR